MGRPGYAVTDWSEISIGEVVYFFTGGGWKKGTVQQQKNSQLLLIHVNGSKEIKVTVWDLRNVRRKDCPTGAQLSDGRHDSRQKSLFDS